MSLRTGARGWHCLTVPTLLCGLLILCVDCAADPVKGSDVFLQNCAVCHSLFAGGVGVGPSLFDIFGRAAAARSFAYSEALKLKGREGLLWTEVPLKQWVLKPSSLVPGTSMGFSGLRYPEDADLLVAFLKNEGKDPASGSQ